MKYFGRILVFVVLAVNVVLAGLLLFSAFSIYLHPAAYALPACAGIAFPIFLSANLLILLFWAVVRHYRCLLVSGLALLVCYPQIRTYFPMNLGGQEAPEGSISLLSYNVMGFDGCMKDEEGRNPILDYLCRSGADVLCLQEYATAGGKRHLTQSDVEKALKAYPYHSLAKAGNGGCYNRLACYAKYPILSATRVDYESAHNGSVMYKLLVGTDTLTLINNHLESNKLTKEDKVAYESVLEDPKQPEAKSNVLKLVRKLAEASAIRSLQADSVAVLIDRLQARRTVVCGDFNDTPVSYTHRAIGRRLNDAFVESGNGMGVSYNQNQFYFRIDHILVSDDIQSYQCRVDRSIKNSDHYPIRCFIKLKIEN